MTLIQKNKRRPAMASLRKSPLLLKVEGHVAHDLLKFTSLLLHVNHRRLRVPTDLNVRTESLKIRGLSADVVYHVVERPQLGIGSLLEHLLAHKSICLVEVLDKKRLLDTKSSRVDVLHIETIQRLSGWRVLSLYTHQFREKRKTWRTTSFSLPSTWSWDFTLECID